MKRSARCVFVDRVEVDLIDQNLCVDACRDLADLTKNAVGSGAAARDVKVGYMKYYFCFGRERFANFFWVDRESIFFASREANDCRLQITRGGDDQFVGWAF